ncbi:hypothetical protein PHYSODRAFT_248857 [Phytophthora sojae]|uniref:Uncharacterized protein n=1 Tax=Phytophthora sojae (strain P6497) TaxID=1094619 RepID=G4YJG8_PHYSP|nr:hypothetical protein PHYSODRAFT_248857 [Phytophthora sojae]EGZ29923.1 hypothetical protein PHYSODRAFT_248857 [Phytophthora sojae]|eukprot:XP_009517198.1 hypothetical protein PHYSODRAFT_248857 [Phytophthora sojae]
MAKVVKSAIPATPAKSSGTRNELSVRPGSSFSTSATDRMESIDERSASYNMAIDFSDAKEDEEDDDWNVRTVMSEGSEAAIVSAGRSGGSRSITRDLSEIFNAMPGPEPAYDADDDATEGFKPSVTVGGVSSKPVGTRPPLNGDTPAVNKVLGRCLDMMKTKSEWMQLFSPKQVRQAIWMDLGGAMVTPINSTSTRQVAQNTVDLLRAMGASSRSSRRRQRSQVGRRLPRPRRRKKLCSAFRVTDVSARGAKFSLGGGRPIEGPATSDPSTDDGVYATKGEASPYCKTRTR